MGVITLSVNSFRPRLITGLWLVRHMRHLGFVGPPTFLALINGLFRIISTWGDLANRLGWPPLLRRPPCLLLVSWHLAYRFSGSGEHLEYLGSPTRSYNSGYTHLAAMRWISPTWVLATEFNLKLSEGGIGFEYLFSLKHYSTSTVLVWGKDWSRRVKWGMFSMRYSPRASVATI